MIDRADLLVAYVTTESGGAAHCMNYALKKGVDVVNIAESEN